jgi:hypothetical protein
VETHYQLAQPENAWPGQGAEDVRYAAGSGSAGAVIAKLVALVPRPRVNLSRNGFKLRIADEATPTVTFFAYQSCDRWETAVN